MSAYLLAAASCGIALVQGARTTEAFDQGLMVEWQHKRMQANPRVVVFSGGVRALYGSTILESDKLTLYLEDSVKKGVAEGSVRLIDPDGTIQAERSEFSWGEHAGNANEVEVEAGRLRVSALHVDFDPQRWKIEDFEAAACPETIPHFSIRGSSATIVPGRSISIERPEFRAFGARLLTLPRYTVSLSNSRPGLRMPQVSYKQGRGFGFAWHSGYTINELSALSFGLKSFPREATSGRFELATSLLPARDAVGGLLPRSDLDEPFAYGYFENVRVSSPDAEREAIGANRTVVSVGTSWNQTPGARKSEEMLTKPWEIVLEDGREVKGFAIATQVRSHAIRDQSTPLEVRLMGSLTLAAPNIDILPGLYVSMRGEATGFLNPGTDSGWLLGQAGLVYRPNEFFRVGAALSQGLEFGFARFASDELYSTRTLHLRADLDLGATTLGILGKYGFGDRRWFDTEISLSQVAGCLEPYVLYRRFPRTLSFGVRFRLDDLFERIERRANPQRAPESHSDR